MLHNTKMGHRFHSHKSAEILSTSPRVIRATELATRSSSVRVKPLQQPSNSYTERLKAQSGHHDTLNSRRTSQRNQITSASHSNSLRKARKPRHLDDGDILVTKRRLATQYYRQSAESTNPNIAGREAGEVLRSESATIKERNGKVKKQEDFGSERLFSHDKESLEENDIREETKQAQTWHVREEDEAREFWMQYRMALQVEEGEALRPGYLLSPLLVERKASRPQTWRNSSNNFFPRSLRHLHQEDIVATVLEGKMKSKELAEQKVLEPATCEL